MKRFISGLMLLTIFLTACSTTNEKKKTETPSESKGEVFELPDESVPVQGGDTNVQEPNDGEVQDDPQSGETQDITDGEDINPEEPTSPSSEGAKVTEPSSDTTDTPTEPASSEASEPTEPQIVDKRIYEDYLAALTLLSLSMEYPDFELQGIYSSGKVYIEKKFDSKGIYAMFTSGGSSYTAYVYPIEEERTAPGTMDIYSAEVGIAAFDLVNGADDNYTEISQDAYASVISELSSVSIFSH